MSVRIVSLCALVSAFVSFGVDAAEPPTAALDAYVRKPDSSTSNRVISTSETPLGRVVRFQFTSQTWQEIPWKHALGVVIPKEEKYPDAMLLFITGGAIGGELRDGDLGLAFSLAKSCGARVAVLPQVPNQPLLGDRKEDSLIAETFVRYLETKDANWPLLFPMVKSAVKAMDVLQAWGEAEGKPVRRFVVTGASKRGWTTWLTGASDPRVAAICPMVIPTLNFKAQNEHQIASFGKYSEQIDDYTSRGLMERIKEPEGEVLWRMVDPLSFRDRLRMPKLQINGTNDPYWTVDSLNIYWDELEGPSRVVYLPNAGHGLDKHREYALQAVGAQFHNAIGGKALPELSWKHDRDASGKFRLTIESSPAPKAVKLWTATSATKDFRKSEWTSRDLEPSAKIEATPADVAGANIAYFGDLTFEIEGQPFHLSTQIRQFPVEKK
ncbi:MAG: PhoPQ-activated protein PqaA family protein [Isosphaeraceae bacterium]|nr:PhoPQ-activated protein PqaA family protein [Isosphaeraceae bacterium]